MDVVRDVCGVQAQLLAAAELAISVRVAALSQREVRAALWERRSLVRAWTVRGTIHIVPAHDVPLWVSAIGERRYWEARDWLAANDLTAVEMTAIIDAVVAALDGRALTRAELADAVVAQLGSRIRPKVASFWGDLLAPVTYLGKLCFGPQRGANVTFVRADQWIGGWREVAPDDAWRELLRRWLATYGPATLEGVRRWFGIEREDAERRLGDAGAREVKIERIVAWTLDEASPHSCVGGASVRLLAQYDPYIVRSHPRESLVSEAARARIRTFKRGRFEGATGVPVLLVDGVVQGVWDRRTHGGRIEISVEPVVRLTNDQHRELEDEVARIGRFFGRSTDLRVAAIP